MQNEIERMCETVVSTLNNWNMQKFYLYSTKYEAGRSYYLRYFLFRSTRLHFYGNGMDKHEVNNCNYCMYCSITFT